MCGIIGVTGEPDALAVILAALHKLEYRGYDSAGVALVADGEIWRVRAADGTRSVAELTTRAADGSAPAVASTGIGHTRWATHGHPTVDNAHPHLDCTGRLAVIHNGIIENHAALRAELVAGGHTMCSATDTEVVAHLIEGHMAHGLPLAEATRAALGAVRGAFSIAVVHADEPDTIVAARRSTPLILGLRDGVALLASDIPALLGQADPPVRPGRRRAGHPHPGHHHGHHPGGGPGRPRGVAHHLGSRGGPEGRLRGLHVQGDARAAPCGGQHAAGPPRRRRPPGAGRNAAEPEALRQVDKVCIVACGSSYHAALVAKYAIERWVKLPTEVDIASEFRYRDPVMTERTLCVGVSQSGETLDTSKAVEEASRLGAKVLVVTNVVDSSMARAADGVLYTRAGPEIGVASTKCHLAQIVALELLGLMLAQLQGTLSEGQIAAVLDEMDRLPDLIEETLRRVPAVDDVAGKLVEARDFFFLGRHVGFPMALEGALKLKELAYLRAEGYAAGELKHGPIALIEPGTVVVGIATRNRLWEKLLSNIAEVHSRGATVVLVADDGDEEAAAVADHVLWVPPCQPLLSPVVGVVPLQQLAYRLARLRGHDVDRPRNLAKTVTVE